MDEDSKPTSVPLDDDQKPADDTDEGADEQPVGMGDDEDNDAPTKDEAVDKADKKKGPDGEDCEFC